jgi:glycerol uptake operon antiterminator
LRKTLLLLLCHHAELFDEVTESRVKVVFLLSSNILEIEDIVERLKDKGKKVFVHVDLIEGLGKNSGSN